MAHEIERKFLVGEAPPDLDRCPSDDILQGYVAIDRTPFYLEAGGQVSDVGELRTDDGVRAPVQVRGVLAKGRTSQE